MRGKQIRAAEAVILETLRGRKLEVFCGECGAGHEANWKSVRVKNTSEFLAWSEVECHCGCTLNSFIGNDDAFDWALECAKRQESQPGAKPTPVDNPISGQRGVSFAQPRSRPV